MNIQDRRLIEDYLPIQAISAEAAVGGFEVGVGEGLRFVYGVLRHLCTPLVLRSEEAPLLRRVAKIWIEVDLMG